MRRPPTAILVIEALVLGLPATLLTLFYLPYNLMYAGLITVASFASPLEGILMLPVALFFVSGPAAVLAYWILAARVWIGAPFRFRWPYWLACGAIAAASCLFYAMAGGPPKSLHSLGTLDLIIAAPLACWIHFSLLVRSRPPQTPPPLPASFQ